VLTVLAAEGTAAALASPINRPQVLRRGRVLAAAAGLAGGGPAAELAIRRQPPAATAPVELLSRLDVPAAGTALDTRHAAVPAGW
jgi:hypothetical protein